MVVQKYGGDSPSSICQVGVEWPPPPRGVILPFYLQQETPPLNHVSS